MKKQIGKNTLGGGQKMSVDLRTYNRSTHDLSYAWRTTMCPGALVPCMKLVGLPGDTFDIDINALVMTHPTVGPLFGSYKLQVDIFTCPMRLYIAQLHNNALNVGLNMQDIELPQITMLTKTREMTTFSSSSILAYLGIKGIRSELQSKKDYTLNALPLLSYIDIFKNYYANKQEKGFPYLRSTSKPVIVTKNSVFHIDPYQYISGIDLAVTLDRTEDLEKLRIEIDGKVYEKSEWSQFLQDANTGGFNFTLKSKPNILDFKLKGNVNRLYIGKELTLYNVSLSELDTLRNYLLSQGDTPVIFKAGLTSDSMKYSTYLYDIIDFNNVYPANADSNGGLILKTYQSDMFNNWVNSEWVDGDNGISKVTAIDTSGGSFTIDTLNLAQKVYNMLNRIAVSGGTYKDWVETVYSVDYGQHAETPIYEGGYSNEIEFEEVVSNSASGDEPLGTLAGRGRLSDRQKGGRLHIKVKEPCYIMGIVSITPRVDYAQGEDWDTALKTMNDLHKPQLDGIGWQDVMLQQVRWDTKDGLAFGKQPAWLQYMTNVNRVYGNFASRDKQSEAFMTLTRWYDKNNESVDNNEVDVSTYIDPNKFNYTFADVDRGANNFWVQLGFKVEARRVMSAKQIPIM